MASFSFSRFFEEIALCEQLAKQNTVRSSNTAGRTTAKSGHRRRQRNSQTALGASRAQEKGKGKRCDLSSSKPPVEVAEDENGDKDSAHDEQYSHAARVDYSHLRDEMTLLQARLAEVEASNRILTKEKIESANENMGLYQELAEAGNSIQDLRKTVDSLKERTQRLKMENGRWYEAFHAMEDDKNGEIRGLHTNVTKLQAKKKQLTSALHATKSNKTTITNSRDAITHVELEALRARVAKQDTEIMKLKEESKVKDKKLKTASEGLRQLAGAMEYKDKEISQLNLERSWDSNEVHELWEQIQEKIKQEKEYQANVEKLKTVEETVRRLTASMAQRDEEISQLNFERKWDRNEISELWRKVREKGDHELSEKHGSDVRYDIEDQGWKIHQLEQDKKTLESELTTAQTSQAHLVSDVMELVCLVRDAGTSVPYEIMETAKEIGTKVFHTYGA